LLTWRLTVPSCYQLFGDHPVGRPGGQQPPHLQLPALSGSTRPTTTAAADRQADRQVGPLEGLHQPGEIVAGRAGRSCAAHQQLAKQGGHRGRALVEEHAQVAFWRASTWRVVRTWMTLPVRRWMAARACSRPAAQRLLGRLLCEQHPH
jgi:hypothetical protein